MTFKMTLLWADGLLITNLWRLLNQFYLYFYSNSFSRYWSFWVCHLVSREYKAGDVSSSRQSLTEPLTLSVCVCGVPTCMSVSGCQSHWQECSSSRRDKTIRSDNVTELSRSLWLHRIVRLVKLRPPLWPFSKAPTRHASPSLPKSVPPLPTLSLPLIVANLLGSLSACLSVCWAAPGLKRPASFIKRKQAGEITRDAGIWGQLICWQRHRGSPGASTENKPGIYIVWGCFTKQDSSTVVTGESWFFAAPLNCQLNIDGTRQTTFSLLRRGERKGYNTWAIQ